MTSHPLVSIIIPTYNEERYIEECLSSIFSQTYKKVEVIVVDDGSTDATIKKIKKFDVKLIRQKHAGPAIARNKGAKKSKGEVLSFLDADMKYDKEYIKKLIDPILKGKAVGTFNKEEYVANKNNFWSRCWTINSDLPDGQRAPSDLPDELPIFRAIKRQEFMKVGGYSDIGYNDDETLSRKMGVKAKAAHGAISYHNNPETLGEVFFSARWIGRARNFFGSDLINILRFSPVNSLRISLKKILSGAPIGFLVFKIVYDFGIFSGIFLSFGKKSK